MSSNLTVWRSILCALFGVGLFLVPIPHEDSYTIVLGILTQGVTAYLGEHMYLFTLPIFVAGGLVAILYNLTPIAFARRLPAFHLLKQAHWAWTALAINGGLVASMMLLQVGPQWVIGKATGVTAFVDVGGAIFLIIGFGCLFLPFLTDYGLLEFVGVLLRTPFQRTFRLPGRAAIDTLASWVGASSIAVIMTGRQYERGFYTAREAAVIATNFSVVSLPFVYLTARVAGIPDYFFPLYGSMLLICLVLAVITPMLPPLRGLPDEYYQGREGRLQERVPQEESLVGWAQQRALAVAQDAPSVLSSLRQGSLAMLELFLTMMPAAMSIEFLALVIYEYTPILQWLTTPAHPILELLAIPEAAAVAPGLVVGLLDQFVPAVIASTVETPLAKFVLAGLSVTQLIFFAESAMLIWRSAIPLSVPKLVAIFFIRTAIALPMLAILGHWIL
ncbi:MAG: YjiH family protein [Pseudomonadota bacterium]